MEPESGDVKETPDQLRWLVHPAAERPGQTIVLVLIIAILTWVFWDGFGIYYGIFCLAVLIAAMLSFFLPTSYEFDREGVTITSLFFVHNFRPWGDFRSFYHDNVGVQLSPFSRPSRLAVYRGNFIRFSTENREEVLAYLDEHIRQKRISEARDGAR